MITLKYKKHDTAVYISHIDTLRAMVRSVRRAGIEVDFSKGFNPHMLLFFSPPLALGVSSECEYVTADCKGVTPEEFVSRYNAVCAPGFEAVAAFYTPKSPNLAGRIRAADYEFSYSADKSEAVAAAVKAVMTSDVYEVGQTTKGGPVKKECRKLIYAMEDLGGVLRVKLATGNENLRADRLALQMNEDFGTAFEVTGIVKKVQYAEHDGAVIPADEFLVKTGEEVK